MKFKNIKLNKKVKLYDLLDKDEYINFLILTMLISFLIILLFGICLYLIASEEIKKIISNIAYFGFYFLLFLVSLSLFFYILSSFYYAVAYNIKGLLRSRYLPISENEIKKLSINNLNNYLNFINNFMKEKKIITKDNYYYLLYLHDKHIDFISKLAKKEYNENIIFIRTNDVNNNLFNRFCLFKKDKKIYFAFQDNNTKYSNSSYNIDYEYNIYGAEIIYSK